METFENLLKKRPPPAQNSPFQGAHLGLMELWSTAHRIMETAWDWRPQFSPISSYVVLDISLNFPESWFPFTFVNLKVIYINHGNFSYNCGKCKFY